MVEYLNRARALVSEKGADSEEIKQLCKEVQDSNNPLIKSLLDL